VTPAAIDLVDTLSCSSFGVESVQVDLTHPSNLYFQAHCQGIWKSTDYGVTWTGPINKGTHGATVKDCAGGITVAPTAGVPTIYEACIRGAAYGLWKSVDGGVNWVQLRVVPPLPSGRPDCYPLVVDPYNSNHLLMSGHEQNFLLQSMDAGVTWASITMPSGMQEAGGTGEQFFINTGNAATTANTWLWLAQQSGGTYGTWRTADGGATWVQVDKNEHPHGASQIYQPDNNGVVYMAGAYSALGWGVLRSTDYGKTWTHVGAVTNETGVFGTSKNVYSMYGWSTNAPVGANFESATQPGTGSWRTPTAQSFTGGPHEVRAVNDGTHNILVGAMGLSGIWRYVEP
jgi:hypothetical protein